MKRTLALGAALALTTSLALAQGYGPGMMGQGTMGYGPGPGMTGSGTYGMYGGGMMMGPGMMGGPMMASLKLTDQQEDKLFALHEQMRAKNFATMGKVHAEQFKMYRLMKGENVDSKAVVEQQKKVDDARREMFATHLEMRKQVEAILTPEQRKQFNQYGPWHE